MGPRLTCTLSGQMCNPSGGCDFAEADRFFGMSGHREREGVGGKIMTMWGYRVEDAMQSELASAGYWKG